MFSLKKLTRIGFEVDAAINGRTVRSASDFSLQVEEGLSPAMLGLLDGGARLNVPRLLQRQDRMLIAYRIGLSDILNGIVTNLPPKAGGGYQMMNGMVMMQTGITLDQMFGHLAGDFYIQMDMIRKEMEVPSYDREADEIVTEDTENNVPEFTVMIGLKDPTEFQAVLENLATRAEQSAAQNQAPYMLRHNHEGVSTYIFTGNMEDTESTPDPQKTIGAVVLGRHLCLGKWKDVVQLIHNHTTEEELPESPFQQYVSETPGANLIAATPRSFAEKVQEMNADQLRSLDLAGMVKGWVEEGLDLPVEDKELEARLQKSLVKCGELVMKVLENSQNYTPQDSVVIGKLYDDVYRMHSSQLMVFPEKAADEKRD